MRLPRALRTIGSMCSAPALRRTPNASLAPKRWLMSTEPSTLPRSRHSTNAERSGASSGRLTTRSTRPPGALVPACTPERPFRMSTRALFSSGIEVSALIGRPSRRKLKRLSTTKPRIGEVVDVALGVVGRRHRRHRSASGPRGGARRRRGSAPRRSSSPAAARPRAACRPSRRRSPAIGALPVTATGASVRLRVARRCASDAGRGEREGERRAARLEGRVEPSSFRWQGSGPRGTGAAGSACFPARGLPQSGSKGLSQSKRDDSRPNTPSECAPAEAGARTEVYGKPGATPSSLCSLVLVVVYCSGCARSGWTSSPIANAASVASWKPQTISFCLPG